MQKSDDPFISSANWAQPLTSRLGLDVASETNNLLGNWLKLNHIWLMLSCFACTSFRDAWTNSLCSVACRYWLFCSRSRALIRLISSWLSSLADSKNWPRNCCFLSNTLGGIKLLESNLDNCVVSSINLRFWVSVSGKSLIISINSSAGLMRFWEINSETALSSMSSRIGDLLVFACLIRSLTDSCDGLLVE